MEKVDVKDLLRRLDDLSKFLKIISEDLVEIMRILRLTLNQMLRERGSRLSRTRASL